MYGYTMEQFEIIGDYMDDVQAALDWEAFEEDMLTNPWDE